MATNLPLLIFPRPETTKPPKRKGYAGLPPPPESTEERNRRIESELNRINAELSDAPGDVDKVLVIQTTGKILDFQKAVRAVRGLEWLCEFDFDLDDEDVANSNPSASGKTVKEIKNAGARLYMTAATKTGARKLLSLWKKWQEGEIFDYGFGKWKDIFRQLRVLREWEHEDMFHENGLLEYLEQAIKEGKNLEGDTSEVFEVELHFRQEEKRRQAAARDFIEKIKEAEGEKVSDVCLEEVAFHAFKIRLPYAKLNPFLEAKKTGDKSLLSGIGYLQPSLVKHCRPMSAAQIPTTDDENTEIDEKEFPPCKEDASLVVGLMDGAPFLRHSYLEERIVFDDPNDYAAQYEKPSDQNHGTAMASLICHGDLKAYSSSLPRKIYCQPIMFKDKSDSEDAPEHFPSDEFLEDIIMRGVRHMLKHPRTNSVKVINLSIGIERMPFYRSGVSPLARVLDYLASTHGILFIVSAGNQPAKFLKNNRENFSREKIIDEIGDRQHEWKIISPAESINALTVGALNKDEHSKQMTDNIDPLDGLSATALYSRLGGGFRNSIKPDFIVAGGRLHYHWSVDGKTLSPNEGYLNQGLEYAAPDKHQGGVKHKNKKFGTSNAAALTTHAAGEIYEVLESINKEQTQAFEDKYYPLLIKALLAHGASREGISGIYENVLKERASQGQWKAYLSRFVGYGVPDFNRAKECTESRVVSLGYGDIAERERHRYTLRLPAKCRDSGRVVVIATLAWFSPISMTNQKYRKAKLLFSVNDGAYSPEKDISPSAERECLRYQVKKGTLQHEVLNLELSDLPEILDVSVDCFADATDRLDAPVAYGLAVTLEVAEGIDIYQPIKQANAAIIEASS